MLLLNASISSCRANSPVSRGGQDPSFQPAKMRFDHSWPWACGTVKKLNARVRMIADRFPRGGKAARYFAEPTQIKRAGKFDIHFTNPIAGTSRNLHPMRLPTESVKRGFCCAKEFGETSSRGEKWNCVQRCGHLFFFASGFLRAEASQNSRSSISTSAYAERKVRSKAFKLRSENSSAGSERALTK